MWVIVGKRHSETFKLIHIGYICSFCSLFHWTNHRLALALSFSLAFRSVNNNWPIVFNRKLIFKLVGIEICHRCWHELTIYTSITHLVCTLFNKQRLQFMIFDFWKLGIPLEHSKLLLHVFCMLCSYRHSRWPNFTLEFQLSFPLSFRYPPLPFLIA